MVSKVGVLFGPSQNDHALLILYFGPFSSGRTLIFALGARRPLVEEDLYEPTENNRVRQVAQRLESAWEKESLKKVPSFGRAIFRANSNWLWFHLTVQVALLIIRLSLPILLGYFIDWFGEKESVPLIYDRDLDGYIWAAMYAALNLLYAFFPASYFHNTMVQGS